MFSLKSMFCKIGFLLIVGLLNRYASIVGAVLILLYYLFAPPFLGLEYSRPVDKIIEEAKILLNKGAKEICLLGQNVNAYNGIYRNTNWNLAFEPFQQVSGQNILKEIIIRNHGC